MLYCHVQLCIAITYVHTSFSLSLLLPSFESDEVRFNLMALVTDHKLVYQRQMKAIQERVEAAATKVGRLDRWRSQLGCDQLEQDRFHCEVGPLHGPTSVVVLMSAPGMRNCVPGITIGTIDSILIAFRCQYGG